MVIFPQDSITEHNYSVTIDWEDLKYNFNLKPMWKSDIECTQCIIFRCKFWKIPRRVMIKRAGCVIAGESSHLPGVSCQRPGWGAAIQGHPQAGFPLWGPGLWERFFLDLLQHHHPLNTSCFWKNSSACRFKTGWKVWIIGSRGVQVQESSFSLHPNGSYRYYTVKYVFTITWIFFKKQNMGNLKSTFTSRQTNSLCCLSGDMSLDLNRVYEQEGALKEETLSYSPKKVCGWRLSSKVHGCDD